MKLRTDQSLIAKWIKNNVKWWVEGKIQDSEYIKTSFPSFIKEINSLGGCLSE